MRRIVSLWLPNLATDRPPGPPPPASAAAPSEAGGAAADPARLRRLAGWCRRYTPWTAPDAAAEAGATVAGGGLLLDVTGCAHLVGGEAALLAELRTRLEGFGFAVRAALADGIGAAWALARFAPAPATLVAAGDDAAAVLAPLPVAALRLPAAVVCGLDRVGLRRIGDLLPLPRPALAARFGARLLLRLDQALGAADEPLSPLTPAPAFAARLAFAEPIAHAPDIAAATGHLLAELARRLAAAQRGARRLDLACYRSDGRVASAAVGTSRPVRDPAHLAALFRDRLAGLDPGCGIEVMILAADIVEPLAPAQLALAGDGPAAAGDAEEAMARLIDRLSNRLGAAAVVRLAERPSHLPERAWCAIPALQRPPLPPPSSPAPAAEDWRRPPRPLELLAPPEPIAVIAPLPDGPPALFRWRRSAHRVAAAFGPERIAAEWWRHDDGGGGDPPADARDYYRIEDADGRRFWVYRDGPDRPGRPARWYLHGLFA
jgi:protein ImuB